MRILFGSFALALSLELGSGVVSSRSFCQSTENREDFLGAAQNQAVIKMALARRSVREIFQQELGDPPGWH
jgi:hypothetical protein